MIVESAHGGSGTQQAGVALFGGLDRAGRCSGTVASWQDLSLHLPGSWGFSVATSIWSDGTRTYVAGYGYNNATGRDGALLWVVPEPGTLSALGIGALAVALRRRRGRRKPQDS